MVTKEWCPLTWPAATLEFLDGVTAQTTLSSSTLGIPVTVQLIVNSLDWMEVSKDAGHVIIG